MDHMMDSHEVKEATLAAIAERRQGSRLPAEGEVVLLLEQPAQVEVRGRLLDASADGFRMSHMYAALPSGATVRCRYRNIDGMARVAWNRIIDEEVESGFMLI